MALIGEVRRRFPLMAVAGSAGPAQPAVRPSSVKVSPG
jgi:hypothetical protein